MNLTQGISFIGAGNVAHSLIPALLNAGFTIDAIYAKTNTHVQPLAQKYNLRWSTNLNKITSKIVIISVSDSALPHVANTIPISSQRTIFHTTGSQAIDILTINHKNCGVLYPLQTFSANREIDFKHIPICIEASNEESLEQLKKISSSLSHNVQQITSNQRIKLHIAAVFACNFTNLMYTYGNDIIQSNNLNFSIIMPLIQETVQKAIENMPENVQTGPAIRRDNITIEKHIKQLPPEFAEKYKLLSEWIKNRFIFEGNKK